MYNVGDLVFGNTGCTERAYVDKKRLTSLSPIPKELIEGFTPEEFVYLMNNGLAAYGGIDVMTGIKAGDTVVVSTAAGATGLLVLQLLKYRGINAIGLTSEIKKTVIEKHCTKAVDYKDQEVLEACLKQNKFKYYFDNVGEWLLDLAIKYIQPYGVLSLCGATSNYLHVSFY
jgi:NADPH-dependent curcumin reductase CurA